MSISLLKKFSALWKTELRRLLCSAPLCFDRNFVLIAGMMVREMTSELRRAAEMVSGRALRNSPRMPLTRSIGKKAKTVVMVPAMSGHL